MKRGNRLKLVGIAILLFGAIMMLNIQTAHATATIRLQDVNGYLDIVDGDSNDTNATVGVVSYSGGFDSMWTVNVTTGITYPTLGSLSYPELDLNSVNVSSSSGGSLNIYFSETGFGPTGTSQFTTQIGGTTGGTVTGYSYLDSGNSLFGTSTLLGSLGPNVSAFSGTTTTSLDPSDPYSLTNMVTITHSGSAITSFNLTTTVVPEPVSSTLFVIGGALLGYMRFRKMKKS